ncbi:MAG: hypothetical protein AAFQ41_02295 [Cyanobacteria bacterium J06623_7]
MQYYRHILSLLFIVIVEKKLNNYAMDELVRKIVSLGFPGVILLVAMATTGFTGAAAITAALAMLGPGGMLGGIMFLGVVGIASDALSKYGLETILKNVYLERKLKGESSISLINEIKSLPVSREMKCCLCESIK